MTDAADGKLRSRTEDRSEGQARAGRPTCQRMLAATPELDLAALHHFWSGGQAPKETDPKELRARILACMLEPSVVEERVGGLGRRLATVLELLLDGSNYGRTFEDLRAAKSLSYLSDYDLEACLAALVRQGLAVETRSTGFESYGQRSIALPREIGDGLVRQRRARTGGVFDLLTLRGHLDRAAADPAAAVRAQPQRVREMYKLYAAESASVARIERLPEGVRELVERAVLEFGGILPKSLFERMQSELPHWNAKRWGMILEQSLVGTVQRLDLTRHRINHDEDTLIVFHEVALAWLRKVAVPSDPDRPDEELSRGVELVANVSRFLSFIHEHDVRYTVRGEIFKTTEKRILQELIPNPGRELSREEVLQFIFSYCRQTGLIEGTGERTFSVSAQGRSFEQLSLQEKLGSLLEFALDDRTLPGDPHHHGRLRQVFLRMCKRIEPGTWYDLMYIPFVARNHYVANLGEAEGGESRDDRSAGVHGAAMEDSQRLAWNLVRWVRQRLYLIGIVDLGYDRQKRPVAMRLSPQGARLLGFEVEDEGARARGGSLVVTPDFEVVLFPSGDDSELIHALDRFCSREKRDETVHFRIQERSVRRALVQGMRLGQILQTLEDHSRTPLPQNVVFSIRDWAVQAGLMVLDSSLELSSENPDALKRLRQDPGVRSYVQRVVDDRRVQLEPRTTPRRMRALLRELGYLVELSPEAA